MRKVVADWLPVLLAIALAVLVVALKLKVPW